MRLLLHVRHISKLSQNLYSGQNQTVVLFQDAFQPLEDEKSY